MSSEESFDRMTKIITACLKKEELLFEYFY
jgi:hypothetical protein